MSLIDDIVRASRRRLEERRAGTPLAELQARAKDAPRSRVSLLDGLRAHDFSVIAEIKHRSPSGGVMDWANISSALTVYEESTSVSAISILTDQDYFGSSIDSLTKARAGSEKPLLRKDFIVDDYQVWEARAFGADAILLMAGLHADEPGRAPRLYSLARSLGMDVLFEIGMSSASLQSQCAVIPEDAPIWGVNSRRFKTTRWQIMAKLGRLLRKEMSTDTDRHRALRDRIPAGKVAVAESGIKAPRDVRTLAGLGYRAALIGTAFLKPGTKVREAVAGFDREILALRVSPASAAADTFSPADAGIPSGGLIAR